MIRKYVVLTLALITLLSCAAGENAIRGYSKTDGYTYVTLGTYPQTAEGEERPILWRVLTSDTDSAYLLSEYILFARCMNASLKDYRDVMKGDFAQTDLCRYLNTDFADQTFTEAELAMLLPFEHYGKVFLPDVSDLKNKDYGLGETYVGKKWSDKVSQNPGLRAWGTEYALKHNGFDPAEYPDVKKKYEGSSQKPMPLKELRLFAYSAQWGSHSPYWTRTVSTSDKRHARCIKAEGDIGHIEVGRDNEGVRPAVMLSLAKSEIIGGEGTKENPYVLGGVAQ